MNTVKTNPLVTRQDVLNAALQLIEPASKCLTPGKARMIAGYSSAHYPEDVAGMEGYSRILWALVPMLIGKCPEAEPYWAMWREGLINGTDPQHDEYWGTIGDKDQRMVEMAVIGMGLCFLPDRFYGELKPEQRDHLIQWLDQINHYDMPLNNWRFFRILVNIGFYKVGRPVNEERMREDIALMESRYEGDGWYFDEPTQRDYYTLWAFHYYSLLYAIVMKDDDPERCAHFTDRARQIAPRFACWFDKDGFGLPYGRSLTYRFAQGSFWAAMAFAGLTTQELGYGEIKGLLLRNLRAWLRLPIYDVNGLLTVGYGYPNLCASEGYNAPGSPYWAMKSFLALALPESHPFWQAEEREYTPPRQFLDEHVRLLLTRDAANSQVVAYTAGNHNPSHMHGDEKYEKFCYSTKHAFSVIKESGTLEKGAFDSMLVVKRRGKDLWHARSGCESFELGEDAVRFVWSPMEGVTIHTVIAPVGMWHVRKHVVETEFPLEAAEGAFSVPKDWAGKRPCDRIASRLAADEHGAVAHGARGTSAVFALRGYDRGEIICPECNTNLMYPRTMLPTLRATLEPGKTTLLCAVFTDTGDARPEKVPQQVLDAAAAL